MGSSSYSDNSGNNSNSSLSHNTTKQKQGCDEENLMECRSTVTGGIGIVHNVNIEELFQSYTSRRRSPRKHSVSDRRDNREIQSVLESLGNPEEEKQKRMNESTIVNQTLPQGTTVQSTNVRQMLLFNDIQWKVLSKGYLPNKTLKRDHAVAYLGTGASEEEIQMNSTRCNFLINNWVNLETWW